MRAITLISLSLLTFIAFAGPFGPGGTNSGGIFSPAPEGGGGGSGITSLNGETGSSQTFANGSSGTAPAFVSSGSEHSLNIPLASTNSVTAGLISKTDYDAFNAKLNTANPLFTGDMTASAPNFFNTATDSNTQISGGSSTDLGGNIDLKGESEAGNSTDGSLFFRNGTTVVGRYRLRTSDGREDFIFPEGTLVAGPSSWTGDGAIGSIQSAITGANTVRLAVVRTSGIVSSQMVLKDGTRNRRINTFVDDTLGTAGMNVTASSGAPDFYFLSGDVETWRIMNNGGSPRFIAANAEVTSLTASKPVFTDSNKKLVSTGTLGADQGGTGGSSAASTGLAKVAAGTWSYATLVNADVSASAAIDYSKLATLTAGNVLLGNASNVPTSTALSGDVTVNSSGTTAIGSGVIVNADVSASAAIAFSKLATLTAGNILLGNASNVPTSTALSGDVTVNSSGVAAIGSGVIVNADINASAAIALSKISQTGLVEDFHIHVETVANKTYTLAQKNRVARQVTKIAAICKTSGSVTAKLQIDGVDISTCTGISVTTAESDTTCNTGSTNDLPLDGTLTLVTSSNSACLDLAITVETTRD
jgi:hypothetical protein